MAEGDRGDRVPRIMLRDALALARRLEAGPSGQIIYDRTPWPLYTWVCWGQQGTERVAADPDLEELLRRLGRPFHLWSVWGDTGGRPGLAFVSSQDGVQWTIRKEQ